jgi:hypothetical protein
MVGRLVADRMLREDDDDNAKRELPPVATLVVVARRELYPINDSVLPRVRRLNVVAGEPPCCEGGDSPCCDDEESALEEALTLLP